MWRALLIGSCLLALGCQTASPAVGPVNYALVVDTGSAEITGRAVAPREDVQTLTLSEQPVRGATVELVDTNGKPVAGVPSVSTGADGTFHLLGAPVGQSLYVRVQYDGPEGRRRALQSYVMPQASHMCAQVSLATTLLAFRIAEEQLTSPDFQPAMPAPLLPAVSQAVPAALLKAIGPDGNLSLFLDALTDTLVPAATPASPSSASSLQTVLQQVFKEPAIADMVAQPATSLEVGFSIQSGDNRGGFAGRKEQRYWLTGNAVLSCQAPEGRLSGMTFWLNNRKLADGVYEQGQWTARADLTGWESGPYVLSARGEEADGSGSSVLSKTYVFVPAPPSCD